MLCFINSGSVRLVQLGGKSYYMPKTIFITKWCRREVLSAPIDLVTEGEGAPRAPGAGFAFVMPAAGEIAWKCVEPIRASFLGVSA